MRAAQGGRLRLLLVVLIALAVNMEEISSKAASEEKCQCDAEPFDRGRIPAALTRNRGHGGFHGGECSAPAEPQFEIPGHQIEVALAADLTPNEEHRDQR